MIASHIPGGENVSADRGSREFTDMSEWKLDPIIIQPFRLNCRQTDLSASRLTSQPRSSNVSSSSLGRVSHLYQRFQAEGIPTNVADLLTRSSTHKSYECSWTVGAAGVLDGKLILLRHL